MRVENESREIENGNESNEIENETPRFLRLRLRVHFCKKFNLVFSHFRESENES